MQSVWLIILRSGNTSIKWLEMILRIKAQKKFIIFAFKTCGFVNWRPGSVCFGVRSRSASSIAAIKRFTLFGLDRTKLWVILEVAIRTPPSFCGFFCVLIIRLAEKCVNRGVMFFLCTVEYESIIKPVFLHKSEDFKRMIGKADESLWRKATGPVKADIRNPLRYLPDHKGSSRKRVLPYDIS